MTTATAPATTKQLSDAARTSEIRTLAEKWEAYREILIDLANNDERNPDEILTALESMGKTHADLENDVRAMRGRLDRRRAIDTGEQAAKHRVQVEAELKAADEAFRKIRDKHVEHCKALYARIDASKQRESGAHDARRQLRRTVLDPSHHARVLALDERRKEVGQRRRVVEFALCAGHLGSIARKREGLIEQRPQLEAEVQRFSTARHGEKKRAAETELQRCHAEIAEADERIKKLRADLVEINKQSAQIEAEGDQLRAEACRP